MSACLLNKKCRNVIGQISGREQWTEIIKVSSGLEGRLMTFHLFSRTRQFSLERKAVVSAMLAPPKCQLKPSCNASSSKDVPRHTAQCDFIEKRVFKIKQPKLRYRVGEIFSVYYRRTFCYFTLYYAVYFTDRHSKNTKAVCILNAILKISL